MKNLTIEQKFVFWFLSFTTILGILILIFARTLLEYIPYFVASVIFLYGFELLLKFIIIEKKLSKHSHLFDGIIEIALSFIIIICLKENIETICIIWGFWIVIREGKELDESIYEIRNSKLAYIDIIESGILMYFAISLIVNPIEHHAYVHILLTGIEFLFNMLLFLLVLFVNKNKEEKENI